MDLSERERKLLAKRIGILLQGTPCSHALKSWNPWPKCAQAFRRLSEAQVNADDFYSRWQTNYKLQRHTLSKTDVSVDLGSIIQKRLQLPFLGFCRQAQQAKGDPEPTQ